MKKLLFTLCAVMIGYTSALAQSGFTLGANIGMPVGDIEDYSDFKVGADIAYRYNVAPMVDVGGLLGYSRFFIDDVDSPFGSIETTDVEFLPIAVSGRVNLALLFLGADLGYAIGLDDGNDGGFYYRPLVGVKLGPIGVIGSYSGVNVDGDNIGSINLGVEFGF
ncbi:MAG: hypothetical protein R6U03_04065 [Gillisia sp.]